MSLTRSKALLDLGSKLVAQLDAEGDLLTSWMAHYIAELIEAAETASPEAKPTAQSVCAAAILELWKLRAALPDHARPFVELDPILRTLAALDPNGTGYFYHAHVLREVDAAGTKGEERSWLELAMDVDSVARELLRIAVQAAANRAVSKAQPWIKAAVDAGLVDLNIEKPVVEFVRRPDEKDALLKQRASQLDAVAEFARARADALRSDMSEIQGDKQRTRKKGKPSKQKTGPNKRTPRTEKTSSKKKTRVKKAAPKKLATTGLTRKAKGSA